MKVKSEEEINIVYSVKPYISITPGAYHVILRVFSQDSKYEYANPSVSFAINVNPSRQSSFEFTAILSIIFMLGNIYIYIYN